MLSAVRVTITALCLASAACAPSPDSNAVAAVSARIDPSNKAGVTSGDLRTKPNPKGAGTIVYSARTQQSSLGERQFVWVVLDGGTAVAANGPAKQVTPTAPWPREVPDSTWASTGLDRFQATEVLEIAYGK